MNFSKEEIVKIYEIFSRVVDCNGNLKVFKGFDWDLNSNKYMQLIYTELDQDKITKNRSLNKASFKNKSTTTFNSCYTELNKILHLCKESEINDFSEHISQKSIFDIDGKANLCNQANTQFSILLYKFPMLKKEDFDILYNAFYDILKICRFDPSQKDNKTIFYLNIFKKVLDYFTSDINCDIDFYITRDGSIVNITELKDLEDVCKNLLLALKIYRIICLLFKNISFGGSGYKILDEILREILKDELFEVFKKHEKEILEILAIKSLTQNCAKNIIYYGTPGTGKTKFVKDCLDILDPSRERTKWIQFHSNFEYEDFIDGIKPTGVSQSGNLVLEMQNGAFKEFCVEVAKENKKRKENSLDLEPYFFIVDEINRANVAAVFGETLSMLEDSYRCEKAAIRIKNSTFIENLAKNNSSKADELSVVWENNQSKFYIPENIYFIGMMNDVDKSIDCFDLALRRRFKWALMKCDYDSLNDIEAKYSGYKTKCESLNDYITKETYKDAQGNSKNDGLNLGRAYEIGHSYFLKRDGLQEKEIWDHYIEPILREYIRSQFGEDEIESKLQTAEKIYTA